MARVHNVQQDVGPADLLQSGAETGHQVVGKLPDESDRIGDAGALTFTQVHLPGQGIERSEEPVLDDDLMLSGKASEYAGLTGVGVADQRSTQHRIPAGAKILAVLFDVLQLE